MILICTLSLFYFLPLQKFGARFLIHIKKALYQKNQRNLKIIFNSIDQSLYTACYFWQESYPYNREKHMKIFCLDCISDSNMLILESYHNGIY